VNRLPGTPILMVALLFCTAAFGGSHSAVSRNESTPTSTAQDAIDVQHVMDAFHDAVTTHNGSRLAAAWSARRVHAPGGSLPAGRAKSEGNAVTRTKYVATRFPGTMNCLSGRLTLIPEVEGPCESLKAQDPLPLQKSQDMQQPLNLLISPC
jgi:hypothetical protein